VTALLVGAHGRASSTAHGYAYIDRFKLRGRKKKERLELNYSEALTRAERDIKQNWSIYRDRFLKGEFP